MKANSRDSKSNLPVKTEFLLYRTEDGAIRIETRMQNETVWLTINQMGELFDVDKSGISRHLKNIFDTGELSRDSVVAFFATTAADGKTYQMEHFNLDAIISVGYRVNSLRGTQFRIWASQRLREYIIKGFAMDDARLKQGGGGNYFDELPSVTAGFTLSAKPRAVLMTINAEGRKIRRSNAARNTSRPLVLTSGRRRTPPRRSGRHQL